MIDLPMSPWPVQSRIGGESGENAGARPLA
ncbi:hypothetical protein SAMN05216516_10780 [Izhakiella capsodis]|uniref:Uncharacterized protein n=1 Tax=Izhakiella capsodis TaxID=1367852 RepID=A0A1I4YXZ9_9GAMM|nr:hypothetical protein SAMN05216516_10780 [Izhakiella capsodis]